MSYNQDNSKASKSQNWENQGYRREVSVVEHIERAIIIGAGIVTIISGGIQIKDRLDQPQQKFLGVASTQMQSR
jgi:hypothetical protein